MSLDAVMIASPVIAVVTVADPAHARPMTQALVRGGVRSVEIMLRTPAALEAVEEAAKVEGAIVGAGTILSVQDYRAAAAAGAAFAVAPGATARLLEACAGAAVPLLPGVVTPSELMLALEFGYTRFKFFPAEASGGPAALAALAGPFPQARFCPTGGVTLDNAQGYLALANVLCVGASWLAPQQLMEAGDWAGVEALARAAVDRLAAASGSASG